MGRNTYGVWTAFSIVLSEPKCVGKHTGECESHVGEVRNSELYPEYRGTRGIPWEGGGTILQA